MKRNFKLLVAVVALIVMVFTFASCDIINAIKPHEHKFSVEWSYDETNHWHAALCEDGEECSSAIADLAAHTFVEGVCSVCDCKEPEPPHTHNFVDGKCECGESDPNYQPPHEHSYGEGVVTTEPTCTEKGVKTFTCSCGDSYTEDIDALGHTYADGKCECGAIDPDHEHKYADGKCTICGAECVEHAYSQEKEDATCTEDGWTKKTCTICGYTTETTIPAYGHDETKVEGKEPTCTSTGLSEGKVCSVCNEVLVEQIVLNKAEHNFVEGVCSACGEVDPEYNGPKTYVLDASTLPAASAGTWEDYETAKLGDADFFTIFYSAKMKIDGSNKTFEDGYKGSQRINFQGAPTFAEGEVKQNLQITIPDGTTGVVKIWWVCGGTYDIKDEEGTVIDTKIRQVAIFDLEGNILQQSNITDTDGVPDSKDELAKNNAIITEFDAIEAGTYYISNVGNSNYFFKVEVVVTPVEEVEDPTKGSINATTTDNNTWIDEVTFTAGGEGNYTFTLPAGLGAWEVTDCDSFPVVMGPYVDYYNNTDGGQFTVGLEAGATLRFYIASEEKKDWVIEWSYEAGEVEDDEPVTPPEGDATQLVVGSNTVVFADGELSEGKTYTFVVTEEGTYTFNCDLMAAVMDAEGNSIGRGQVYLTAGTYSVTLFSMMPMPANSFTVNITYEAPSSGEDSEPDGSEQNPYIWETLPESVVLDYDVISGKVYYIFTATADGSVTFTWPVEFDSWYDIFELDADGNLTNNNDSSFMNTSESFVVEAGKSYRVSLGSWSEAGSHTITIAFVACDHEWSEATCLVLSTCSKCGATTGDYADHIPNSENPTCSDPAECTVCGTEVGYVPHSWDEGTVTQQPDCSTETNGIKLLTCTVCGATQEEEIWAFHDMVVDEEVYATCTEDGYYKAHCSVCGYVEEYVNEAQGHYNWYASCGDTTNCMECGAEFTIEHSGSPATCTEPMYCYNCWQFVGEPLGHNYVDGVCTVCYAEDPDYVPCEHSYFYPCDKVCQICHEITNPNATHTIVYVEAKAATCYENGNIEYWYCSDCGTAWADEAQTQLTNMMSVILPAGHTDLVHFEAIEPGCHYDGNIEYWVCYGCEIVWQDEALTQLTNIKNVVLPATGYPTAYHAAIEPGCHTEGQIEHWTCSQCEQVWADEALTQLTNIKNVVLPATGEGGNIRHIPGVEVTCETIGQHEHWICTTCGQAWTDEALTQLIDMKDVSIPAPGHIIVVDEAVAPTCTTTGLTEGSHCEGCDEKTIAQEVIAALGHTEGDAATCTSAQICTVCKIELVAALGHDYDEGICSACGAVDPNHYFVVSIDDALAAADGKKVQVSGTVCAINTAWSDSYGNISVTIVDENGDELYLYRLKTNVTLGDIITVKGTMATYNNERQIAAGATAEITGHDSSYDYVELTIEEALKADDNTNVIITGTVVMIGTPYNSQYKNISVYIADEDGNQLYLYRLAGGSDLAVNDIITIKGAMATYKGARQVAGATYEEIGVHTCSKYTEATCLELAACVVCGATTGELANHNYVDGICSVCNHTEGAAEVETVTVYKSMSELITANGWTSSTTKQSFTLDNVVSVKINGGSNTGKAYEGNHIRIYATDSPAGTITISVPDGYELVSIKISTVTGTYAFLYVDGTTTDISNATTAVSGSSVVLKSVKNGSDGKQVRVTGIEVTYKVVG